MIPLLVFIPYLYPTRLWTVGEGLLAWMGTDGRYEEIHVTYKSTEKIVPVMKVTTLSPDCYI